MLTLLWQSKALRERWLLDGAPSSGEDEAQKQLQEDEAKTKLLEKTILRFGLIFGLL